MNTLSLNIRKMAYDLGQKAEIAHWGDLIKKTFGLVPVYDKGVHDLQWLLREIYDILKPVPVDLVKACNLKYLVLKSDMGPNRRYSPNHGFFVGNQVALNADIFYHPDQPDDFSDGQVILSQDPPRHFFMKSGMLLISAMVTCLCRRIGWNSQAGAKNPYPGFRDYR